MSALLHDKKLDPLKSNPVDNWTVSVGWMFELHSIFLWRRQPPMLMTVSFPNSSYWKIIRYMFSCLLRSPVLCNDLDQAIIYGKTTRTITLSFAYMFKFHFLRPPNLLTQNSSKNAAWKPTKAPSVSSMFSWTPLSASSFQVRFREGKLHHMKPETAIGFSWDMMHLNASDTVNYYRLEKKRVFVAFVSTLPKKTARNKNIPLYTIRILYSLVYFAN